jgi:hypothetical protein
MAKGVAVRSVVPKTVIILGLLLVVAACQSGESGSSTHPGESTGQPASSSSTRTPVLSYPQRPMRDAVTKSRFVAIYTIDHEELTIQPPPAGPPAMSERAAISRFRLYGLGYVRRGFAAYGSVTLVPRPLALVRITDEPAWVITYFARPIPCPGMLPDQAANAQRFPLSLQLAIVPTDGSPGAEFTSAGRTLCGWLTPTRATWA